jgi:hypothetical protein
VAPREAEREPIRNHGARRGRLGLIHRREGDGAAYLVGASGEADDQAPGHVDWTIQIDRHRSLKDKLTGANKLAADDRLSAAIERLVRQDAGAGEIEVSRDA